MPPRETVPAPTNKTFEPMAAIWSWACCWAPCPTLTMAITAATPIMIPSIVSADRSLLRASALPAMRRICVRFISILRRGHALQDFRGCGPVHDLVVMPDLAVTEVNRAAGEARDVGLVGNEHNRQSLVIEFLEHVHDLDRGAAVEIPSWF